MSADALLSRLTKARRTGRGTWIACCPSHEDRNPSMTIREVDDGRVLVHCFAGCSVVDILGAVGLEFDALFPEKPLERGSPIRKPFPAADVLEALAVEVRFVAVLSSALREGEPLNDQAHERLMLAMERIEAGRTFANG